MVSPPGVGVVVGSEEVEGGALEGAVVEEGGVSEEDSKPEDFPNDQSPHSAMLYCIIDVPCFHTVFKGFFFDMLSCEYSIKDMS